MAHLQLQISPVGDAVSLKSRTYAALRAAILDLNIYDPNARLKLDERDLSQRFGVSRTPLREALSLLATEGLVRVVARKGIYIVKKTKSEILDMIMVWAALEGMAARLVTKHASDEDLRKLRAHVTASDSLGQCRRSDDYSEAHIQFHQAIIHLAKSPLIGHLTDELFFHMRAIRQRANFEQAIVEQNWARRSAADHKEIVIAMEARDPERAERLVREHTLRLRDHVDRYVDLD